MWPNYLLGPNGLDCSSLEFGNESVESYLIQENQMRNDYTFSYGKDLGGVLLIKESP